MTAFCSACGKKVPKRRLVAEANNTHSVFFCSTKCNLAYASQVMQMMRDTELEVEDELRLETGAAGESWAAEALDALDKAAETATAPGQRMSPEEIAARFIGSFAGKFGVKFATRAYTKFAESVRGWVDERAKRKAAEAERSAEQAAERAAKAKINEPPKPTGDEKKPDQKEVPTAGKPPEPPRWKKLKEPEDLDDLPLEEQRAWLLRRFYLPPTATMDEMRVRYKACAKKFHPDNRDTGNGPIMAVINTTKRRLEEIERDLQKSKEKKRQKQQRQTQR